MHTTADKRSNSACRTGFQVDLKYTGAISKRGHGRAARAAGHYAEQRI